MVRWGDCLHIKTAKLLGRWKTTIQLKYVIGILVRIKWFSIRWRWKYMLFFHLFSKWPDRELNDEQNEIAEHRNFAFEFFFCFEHDVHMKLLANKGRRRFIFNHLGARFVFRLHKQNRRHQFIVPQPHHSHARRSYIICDAFFHSVCCHFGFRCWILTHSMLDRPWIMVLWYWTSRDFLYKMVNIDSVNAINHSFGNTVASFEIYTKWNGDLDNFACMSDDNQRQKTDERWALRMPYA